MEVEQLMRQLKVPYVRALPPVLLAVAKAQRCELETPTALDRSER
jgi:hypothetical protein